MGAIIVNPVCWVLGALTFDSFDTESGFLEILFILIVCAPAGAFAARVPIRVHRIEKCPLPRDAPVIVPGRRHEHERVRRG
jgi:hypothetical protein